MTIFIPFLCCPYHYRHVTVCKVTPYLWGPGWALLLWRLANRVRSRRTVVWIPVGRGSLISRHVLTGPGVCTVLTFSRYRSFFPGVKWPEWYWPLHTVKKNRYSSPYHRPWRPRGGVEIWLYSFTSALDGGGWSTPLPGPFTQCTGEWVGPRAGLDGCGKSCPHRDSIPDLPARSE